MIDAVLLEKLSSLIKSHDQESFSKLLSDNPELTDYFCTEDGLHHLQAAVIDSGDAIKKIVLGLPKIAKNRLGYLNEILYRALKAKRLEDVKTLLKDKDVRLSITYGDNRVLLEAADAGYADIVKILLEIDSPSDFILSRTSPLMHALIKNHNEIVAQFLEIKPVAENIMDDDHFFLIVALEFRNWEGVFLLLQHYGSTIIPISLMTAILFIPPHHPLASHIQGLMYHRVLIVDKPLVKDAIELITIQAWIAYWKLKPYEPLTWCRNPVVNKEDWLEYLVEQNTCCTELRQLAITALSYNAITESEPPCSAEIKQLLIDELQKKLDEYFSVCSKSEAEKLCKALLMPSKINATDVIFKSSGVDLSSDLLLVRKAFFEKFIGKFALPPDECNHLIFVMSRQMLEKYNRVLETHEMAFIEHFLFSLGGKDTETYILQAYNRSYPKDVFTHETSVLDAKRVMPTKLSLLRAYHSYTLPLQVGLPAVLLGIGLGLSLAYMEVAPVPIISAISIAAAVTTALIAACYVHSCTPVLEQKTAMRP